MRRLFIGLGLGLLLTASACKDKLEDLPDVDPLDDPWVDAIETGEAEQEAEAVEAEAVEAKAELAAAETGETEGAEVEVEAEPEPTTDDTKLAADAPSQAPKPASQAKAGDPPPPTPDPADEAEQPEAEQPEAVAPTPVAEPETKPEPEPAKPAPITMADFDGTFSFSGGSAQRKAVAAAIEDAAMEVAGIIRGIARKRLNKTQIIEDPVTITVSGDKISFKWGTSGDGMSAVIDGPTVTMKYKGDKYKARVRKSGSKLVTVFQASDATKTIVYVMSSDRKRLTAHHKLVADQLDTPMTFKVSYTRK